MQVSSTWIRLILVAETESATNDGYYDIMTAQERRIALYRLCWFPAHSTLPTTKKCQHVGTLYSKTRFHCSHCCALLALYVYVPVYIIVIFFVSQIKLDWIEHGSKPAANT